jgi:hypothetical protein
MEGQSSSIIQADIVNSGNSEESISNDLAA